MIISNSKDAIHKAWLFRLLNAIYDNAFLANNLYFKGGTCAAMLGYLDRFSIDLDFDLAAENKSPQPPFARGGNIEKNLEIIFKKLGLSIKDRSQKAPQYFLKYPRKENERNTIKIDITTDAPKSNIYKPMIFKDIDRIINCQTIETMFANKLVALIDRFEKNGSIAGRGLYDIHHFFIKGFRYNKEVIIERRKKDLISFFDELILFIEKNINETVINQDLNYLLPNDKFQAIRKVLKNETKMFLEDEMGICEKKLIPMSNAA
ncbi:MAG: nucleotidyl transferase AbiEii/AbiGii toxin family protein [bacterium]